jgi:hypothetical protein
MNQKQLKQVPMLDDSLDIKQHALWIQHKVAKARASPQPLVPHEHVMKKAHALIAEKAKKHAVG